VNTKFSHRIGLVVWLYTPKYVNKLKQFGLLHYVSKKLNYAILYVSQSEKKKTEKNLLKQHFVRSVELSYNNEMDYTFENVLKEVEKMNQSKDNIKTDELTLFTELSEQGGL